VTYHETVQKAIDYIEGNLKESISLYDIAEHVNFSVPHFYRLFNAIVKDTVKSYVLKRKLSNAAIDLKQSQKTISEIAFEYGFESHDVFTRAFCRVFNVSPSRYRHEDIYINFERFIVNKKNIKCEGSYHMNYKIINKNEVIVIGLECKAKPGDTDGSIGKLWSKFLENVDNVKNTTTPSVMYGICEHETCTGDMLTYMAGIEVNYNSNIPVGMVKRVIKPQKFLQAEVPDLIKTPDAYNKTFEYIKQNGYEMDKNDEIEVYEEIFRDPDNNAFKLLVPIK
jgi:AraC family transcriptional regulator